MGRKKKKVKFTTLHLNIAESVLAELDILISDPRTGKVAYGARGELITLLLQETIARVTDQPSSDDPPSLRYLRKLAFSSFPNKEDFS